MNEAWKSVVGYEGLYEVSDAGRIRRIVPSGFRVIRGSATRYIRVMLCRDCERVNRGIHELVAEAFIGPRPPGLQVNHRDGDKTNNRRENLEYATPLENMAHARATGLWEPSGDGNANAKLSADDVTCIRASHRRGNVTELARQYRVSRGTIYSILERRTWRHV